MKRNEMKPYMTLKPSHNRNGGNSWIHHAVMILCFVYAGISLLFFVMQASPMLTGREPHSGIMQRIPLENASSGAFNQTLDIEGEGARPGPGTMRPDARVTGFFNVLLFTSLFGAIISALAGVSLHSLLRKRERKELTRSIVQSMTTDEEKRVIAELENAEGELTQSELVKRTGLGKVKVHRIVKRLEHLSVVKKYPYGVTNKIRLQQMVEK